MILGAPKSKIKTSMLRIVVFILCSLTQTMFGSQHKTKTPLAFANGVSISLVNLTGQMLNRFYGDLKCLFKLKYSIDRLFCQ